MKANGELEGMEIEARNKWGKELNLTNCVGCGAKRGTAKRPTVDFVEMGNVCMPCHLKAHEQLKQDGTD